MNVLSVMSQRKAYVIRAVVVFVILLIAFVVFQLLASHKQVIPTVDPEQQRQRVKVLRVEPIPVRRQWVGYGTAEAVEVANVAARVSATVLRISPNVLEGAEVTRGQVLVELDDSDFRDQLQIAEQNLSAINARLAELDIQETTLTERRSVESRDRDLARDELDRVRTLFEKSAANQKDVDAAERTLLAAERTLLQVEEQLRALGPRRQQLLSERAALQAQADIARENLSRCRIASPINGVVQSIDVEIGETLNIGQRVARIVNLDRIQVPLSLPAHARPYVHVGDTIQLTWAAGEDLSWQAVVERIAPEDDPATRTFSVYGIVTQTHPDNQSHTPLYPGVFVRGVVISDDGLPRLVVPRRSIRTERVTKVVDGILQTEPVHEAFLIDDHLPATGLPDVEWAVIEDGLKPGDLIVVNPVRSLYDGQHVEAILVNSDAQVSRPMDTTTAHRRDDMTTRGDEP
ncbi:MAG: hypothetical protein Kow00105_01150 [Phycisphaeraceae bacterium]